ncbi:hypothetical protein Ancab_006189 [Ancistrocladus abbreviatus]
MMANRAWTTRLQNSIRNLVPQFDQSLVYNVLDNARNSEHALQFFRWVERAGLFQHDSDTHLKIIERLGRASKLNHARCILLDMPKKGAELDEDMFVVLIDSCGGYMMAKRFFNKMVEEGYEEIFVEMKGKNIAPMVISYTTMIKGYISAGKVDDALRMFEEMKNFDVKPNAVTCTTLLSLSVVW